MAKIQDTGQKAGLNMRLVATLIHILACCMLGWAYLKQTREVQGPFHVHMAHSGALPCQSQGHHAINLGMLQTQCSVI